VEYWRGYLQLVEKNHELVEERRKSSGKEARIIQEMRAITDAMNQHMLCCEECQAWLRSF
jgi:hypothetical protein